MYAVAGALAVDCVRHGHPAMVHTIVDCMGEFVRKSLTSWLKRRGGWVRLCTPNDLFVTASVNIADVANVKLLVTQQGNEQRTHTDQVQCLVPSFVCGLS